MSILGSYIRLTADELARARHDPDWVLACVEGAVEGTAGVGTDRPDRPDRSYSTGTAWDALGFLTRRIGFPVDIAHGEEALPWSGGGEVWSYGPPRCLTPGQVRTAAAAMAATGGERLVAGAGPADLARADVYPVDAWERGASLEGVVAHYEALLPFFRAAAADGDALLVWLS
ncbi:YfbM family protein [Streptomyces sp. NBC_00536]|uniref:DUF1877 family protein n=1 Tax=Streptomyces sp. NBC_00536 TaxID=2975769 RepID=UPI002E81A523|nr:DUF1877 family protein [Streptomyces sp. NBC_00536]WUC81254.1 YfbM family protein [Streptomyces sp. NBC_00536]